MAIVADVFDCLMIDEDGEVIGTTTLTEANIEVTVEENDVRGGKGNFLLGILHADRDININLTDTIFRYDFLAKQLGQDIVTGAGVAWAMPKWYEAKSNMGDVEIELEHTPLASNSGIKIFDESGEEIVASDYTLSGDVVTLDTAADGDRIEVRTYQYETSASTQTIEIDNAVFFKGVKCVLQTVEVSGGQEDAEIVANLQYIFDRALPSGNVTISTASAREAQSQEFNLRVIKPKHSTVVGRILREPVSAE